MQQMDASTTSQERSWKKRARLPALIISIVTVTIVTAALFHWVRRPRRFERVVFITLDTLRADHLGYHGYPRDTSPFIDRLAREGVRFERAFATMADTTPSHASMFTSLYPLQHQVLKNGHAMDRSFVTMAELLQGMGYETAGFVSAPIFGMAQLNQGFTVFDEPPAPDHWSKYRQADKTIDAVIKWLDEDTPTDRFFLWVHLFDPHRPFRPPDSVHQTFRTQPAGQREALASFLTQEQHVDLDFYNSEIENMLETMDAYDAEILFLDRELERLFGRFEELGLGPGTLWIITADHGSGLGNHRWRAHGKHIYNEQLHVPLIFYSASKPFAARAVDNVVEHVDLLPTVMELVGGEITGQVETVQGESLAPLLSSPEGGFPKEHAFAQRRDFDPAARPRDLDPEKENYEDGEKYALQNGAFKYIYRTRGDDEFYDLRSDPYETNNLAGSDLESERALRETVVALVEEFTRTVHRRPRSVYKEEFEVLRSLGYTR
jgi:arylsulfatase A-like enzyme